MSISLKELKKNRLTPAEKFVLETIDGVKPKKLPNGNVSWYKDDRCLFAHQFKYDCLSVSYLYIWKVVREEFGLKSDEVFDLLTNLLYDYTDKGKLKINFI